MLEAFFQYVSSRSPGQLVRDGFDVLVVYLLVYGTLRVIRGTRAMQIGVGLGVVFVVYVVARAAQLLAVLSILDAVIASFFLVLVVIFQNDIRRGLMRVGSRGQGLFSLRRGREAEMIDEVVDACTELARHRTGAIITFERDANLDEFVGAHKGHVVDAAVTHELLVALFVPEGMNKLHDGSVVIRDYRIAKAGVFFPMPETRPLDESFGSRHRAAIGITEETDAIVVVVSEERGTISLCFNGNIIPGLDGQTLRRSLEDFFSPKARKKRATVPASARSSALTPPPPVAEPEIREMEEAPVSARATTPTKSEPPPPLRPSRVSDEGRPSRVGDEHAPLRPKAEAAAEEHAPLRARPSVPQAEVEGRTTVKPTEPLLPRGEARSPEPPATADESFRAAQRKRMMPVTTPLPARRRRTGSLEAVRNPTPTTDDDEAVSSGNPDREGS